MKKLLKIETSLYLTLFVVCIFVLLQSPLAPFAKSVNGVDSSMFIYAAQQILDGQLIYKDIVDHKGPFLYFIDVLALFIFNGNFIGIWIFEILSLFVASIMMYKTARLFAGKILSFLAVVTAIISIVPILGGGNFTEEWALPYISIAMYIFMAYLKENKPLTIASLFILSLTFVLTFMLRANLVAIWAGFGITLLIKWIVEKRYKELIHNLSFILLFVLLFSLPFFLYFYCKGTLPDAVYLVFKYNMFEYRPKSVVFILGICGWILCGQTYLSVIPVIIAVYMFLRKRTIVNGGFLLTFGFTALFCSLGGVLGHYFMIFAPLLVIPYVYIFAVIKDSIPKTKYVGLFIIFILYNSTCIITQTKIIRDNYSEKGYNFCNMSPSTMKKLKEVIIQNSKSTDKILVKGFQSCVYIYSDRICATRFPYPICLSSLANEYYVKEAEKALPKLIIQGEVINSSWDSFSLESLLNDKYQLIETNIENVDVWELKE